MRTFNEPDVVVLPLTGAARAQLTAIAALRTARASATVTGRSLTDSRHLSVTKQPIESPLSIRVLPCRRQPRVKGQASCTPGSFASAHYCITQVVPMVGARPGMRQPQLRRLMRTPSIGGGGCCPPNLLSAERYVCATRRSDSGWRVRRAHRAEGACDAMIAAPRSSLRSRSRQGRRRRQMPLGSV